MNLQKTWRLLVWILLFQIVAAVMGYITQHNINPWYHSLVKSPLTPPDVVFGITWTILYIILAVVGFVLHAQTRSHNRQQCIVLYWLQMLLNWAWTPVFFGAQKIFIAMMILVVMVILTALLWGKSYKIKPWITYLITPYLLWLIFACYLNIYIWWEVL